MNIKHIAMLAAIVCAGIVTGCSSNSSTAPDSPSDPFSAPQTPNQNTSDSYYPLTEGSTWTYTGIQSYTQTASGDSVIGGKDWKKLQTNTGAVAYARWIGNKLVGINISPAISTQEIEGLDITPNARWSFDITSTGIPTHYTYVDSLQGQSITVLGHTYTDVIVTHLVYSFSFQGLSETLGGTYYFAKGVGLVEADLDQMGSIMLESYSIK